MIIPKRDNESVPEWIDRVRSMPPLPGYPATPEWWTELFPTERGECKEKDDGDS